MVRIWGYGKVRFWTTCDLWNTHLICPFWSSVFQLVEHCWAMSFILEIYKAKLVQRTPITMVSGRRIVNGVNLNQQTESKPSEMWWNIGTWLSQSMNNFCTRWCPLQWTHGGFRLFSEILKEKTQLFCVNHWNGRRLAEGDWNDHWQSKGSPVESGQLGLNGDFYRVRPQGYLGEFLTATWYDWYGWPSIKKTNMATSPSQKSWGDLPSKLT